MSEGSRHLVQLVAWSIPRHARRKDSARDQLEDLKIIARRMGMHKAAHEIDKMLESKP